ncbi:MAG: hypothetical protein Aurels2KO_38150 [Aureliella sp.]
MNQINSFFPDQLTYDLPLFDLCHDPHDEASTEVGDSSGKPLSGLEKENCQVRIWDVVNSVIVSK